MLLTKAIEMQLLKLVFDTEPAAHTKLHYNISIIIHKYVQLTHIQTHRPKEGEQAILTFAVTQYLHLKKHTDSWFVYVKE